MNLTTDRLKWMTWEENWLKGNSDRISGINTKNSRAVIQMDLNGCVIKTYYSIRQATRELGINNGHISDCCRGKRRTIGGFKWGYA